MALTNERHPLFYLMSFTTPGSPLTASVIGHIFYINKTIDGFDN